MRGLLGKVGDLGGTYEGTQTGKIWDLQANNGSKADKELDLGRQMTGFRQANNGAKAAS